MSTTTIVDSEESGLRLDRWFKRRYPALAHGPLEKLLRTGQVRLDGKRVKASDHVAEGQSIRLPPQLQNLKAPPAKASPEAPEAPKASDQNFINSLVIHEDDALFVLNKPSGLATQGGSGIRRHVDGLLVGLQGNKRHKPKLVHRLDRDTSGVLVVARTQPAAAALSQSLRHRDAQKIYWALTVGVPQPRRGVISLALAKESGFGKHGRDERMATLDKEDAEDTEGAKAATTHYAVIGTAADQYAFVVLKPITGRTHQLRAHLAAIGAPIVGDFKYGGQAAKGLGELEDRLHLHARSIDIAHPMGGRLRIQAPLASHMAKAWDLFGFNADERHNPFAERLEEAERSERQSYSSKKRGDQPSQTSKFNPHKLSKRDPLKRSEAYSSKSPKPGRGKPPRSQGEKASKPPFGKPSRPHSEKPPKSSFGTPSKSDSRKPQRNGQGPASKPRSSFKGRPSFKK